MLCVDKNLNKYFCGLRKRKLTPEQSSITGQVVEMIYKYGQKTWQKVSVERIITSTETNYTIKYFIS